MKTPLCHLNDWLTTPEFPFYSKLTSSADDVLHDHTFFEIFYMLDGDIYHELNGEIQLLHQGDLLFLLPEDRHIFLRDEKNHCRHRDVILRKEFFKSICDFLNADLYKAFVSSETRKKFSLSEEKIAEFEKGFLNVTKASALKNNANIALSFAKVQCAELLGMLLPNGGNDEKEEPDWLTSLINRLSDPAYVSRSWEEILSPFFYSREHICRVFKAKTGKTPTEYLNEQRMILAIGRLTHSQDTILSVCMSLGFSSVAYFNALFKNKYGLSPSAFRKKIQSDDKV